MLSEIEREEIAVVLSHAETSRAAIPEALMVVQRHRGWIPDDAVAGVAALLGSTPAEVDGVATFYSQLYRRPVGRHVILICDSVSCWIMGSASLQYHLTRRLGIDPGETTADGRFTLLPAVCLGACDRAPVMMVDETLYGELTPAIVDEILERYA